MNRTLDFDALVVMAKRPARHEGPRELEARAALAVLFWRQKQPSVVLICVEGHDLPDAEISGAEAVRNLALATGVSKDRVVARSLTNCTVREVAAIHGILRGLGATRPLVVTHPYHVRRTRWYLRAAGDEATVVGCSSELVARMFPMADTLLRGMVERGEVRGLRYAREFVVEILLSLLHFVDRRGRVEMFLADRVRGRMGNQAHDGVVSES